MCVLQMVPISFGRGIKANTSVSTPQSFIALSRTNDPLGGKESRTAVMNALRMEVSLFKRRDRILKILKVCENNIIDTVLFLFLYNFPIGSYINGFLTKTVAV